MSQPSPSRLYGLPRIAAATFEIAAGVLAVLLCALVVPTWLDESLGLSTEAARQLVFAVGFVLGIGLMIIWAVARSRRRWVVVLAVITRGVISTPMITIVPSYRCDDDGMDLVGLNRRTGDVRWHQRGSEPQQSLAHNDFLLELTARPDDTDPDGTAAERGAAVLQRRQLDTGKISWATPLAGTCYDADLPRLDAPGRTVFVAGCGTDDGTRTRLAGYATDSGDQRWRHDFGSPIISFAAVDDQRALVLTSTRATCTADLVDGSGSNTVLSVPRAGREDDSASAPPGSAFCEGSAVHRVGDTFVVQLALPRDADRSTIDDTSRFRFVDLG